ncbi:MAG TPA: hypothetical protein VFQ24_05835 [Terriglobia bacterium]|nr:hypothetical protein [Terriglobia bacterium]
MITWELQAEVKFKFHRHTYGNAATRSGLEAPLVHNLNGEPVKVRADRLNEGNAVQASVSP